MRDLGTLVVLFATATTGLPAYRHVIEGRVITKADEGLDALCPAVFMPMFSEVDDEGNEVVLETGKQACCLVDKVLSSIEVIFDATWCGTSHKLGGGDEEDEEELGHAQCNIQVHLQLQAQRFFTTPSLLSQAVVKLDKETPQCCHMDGGKDNTECLQAMTPITKLVAKVQFMLAFAAQRRH